MPPLTLSSKHHTLIQALLSRGPLKESEFRSTFHKVTGKSPDHQVFVQYISDINDALVYVQLDLRKCLNQYDVKAYYGVVNSVSDEHSKLGTKYSVPQIAVYKGILMFWFLSTEWLQLQMLVEAIVQDTAGEGSISNIDALNIRLENQVSTGMESQSQDTSTEIPSAFKNFSISQKERTLEDFVHDQWLCLTSGGPIGLGAKFCQNEDCKIRMSQCCLKKLFSLGGFKRLCPGCGTQWCLVAKSEATEVQLDDQGGPTENMLPPDSSARKRARTSKGVDCSTQEPNSSVTFGKRRLTKSSIWQSAA